MESPLQRGVRLHQTGHIDEARTLYLEVLGLQPDNADAQHLLGVTYFQQGDALRAIELIGSSIRLDPFNSLAFSNLGNAMQSVGMDDDAVRCYDCALGLDPLQKDAMFNRGVAQQKLTRHSDALISYDHAVALRPAHAQAWLNRGDVLHDLQRDGEAVGSYDAAILIDALDARTHFNRGVALQGLDRNEEALLSYDRAIEVAPTDSRAWNNRGNVYQSLQQYQSALRNYRQANALNPDYGDAHWNEAICLLTTGDLEQGWKKYEWRNHRSASLAAEADASGALWLGRENLEDLSIVLKAEQGLGDTIQFCRYAELVAARGARVTLQIPAILQALMGTLVGVDKVVSVVDDAAHDFHCPLMSLPLAFDTRMSTIPASAAYLFSDPLATGHWQQQLGLHAGRRIGFVWAGNRANGVDQRRSIKLDHFAGLWGDGNQWCCLQKDFSTEEVRFMEQEGVLHFADALPDFSHTAALIEQMDLVISVDTAVAHLAAAMGKPTWLLLSHQSDFRWLLGRRDSPWYPSMLLLRQTRPGDWTDVFAEVARRLRLQQVVHH
jgi:tetratricopeptide (TPR) repeat protein